MQAECEWTALTPEEWQSISTIVQGSTTLDRDNRKIVDAILYKVQSGCSWSKLPTQFGPKAVIRQSHDAWLTDGTLGRIIDAVSLLRGAG